MSEEEVGRPVALLQALYRNLLFLFPRAFRDRFGEEMTEVFDQRLAEAGASGASVLGMVAILEFGQLPAALLGVHRQQWQKQGRKLGNLLAPVPGQALFGEPPADVDGRFSWLHLLLETAPFLASSLLLLVLTYQSPDWLPRAWRDPAGAAPLWAGLLPVPLFLLGMARGLPRWAYPYGGLLAGYTLWAADDLLFRGMWALLLAGAAGLPIAAALLPGDPPLPAFWRRLGASVAVDWTRLSFGLYGAAPLLILAAFDNAYLDDRTPYLALSALLLPPIAVVYGRSRHQRRQLAVLLCGATLLFIPALLDHFYWRGAGAHIGWLVGLWVWTVTLLLMPLLTVPVQWTSHNLASNKRECWRRNE